MSIATEDIHRTVGSFTTKINVSAIDVDNIMSAALEGGINYWCCEAIPWVFKCNNAWPDDVDYTSQCLSRGYDIFLVDAEEDDDNGNPVEYILTLSAMIRGIEKYCDEHSVSYYDLREDHDAEAADCIVQYALFGKLVYG